MLLITERAVPPGNLDLGTGKVARVGVETDST